MYEPYTNQATEYVKDVVIGQRPEIRICTASSNDTIARSGIDKRDKQSSQKQPNTLGRTILTEGCQSGSVSYRGIQGSNKNHNNYHGIRKGGGECSGKDNDCNYQYQGIREHFSWTTVAQFMTNNGFDELSSWSAVAIPFLPHSFGEALPLFGPVEKGPCRGPTFNQGMSSTLRQLFGYLHLSKLSSRRHARSFYTWFTGFSTETYQ